MKIRLNVSVFIRISLFVNLFLSNFSIYAQGVGINKTGAIPDASAVVDMVSTSQGALLPRLTENQRDAIVSPANSLLIYNTTSDCLQIYIGGQWLNIQCGCDRPLAPVAIAATNISNTSFDANWNISTGATTYLLDVDDNSDFSSPIVGYDGLDVTNITTYNVTGISCGVGYYYRVRAGNSCGVSNNSNTILVNASATSYPTGTVHCLAGGSVVQQVTSAGEIWMDRNIGASQVATSSSDALSYGDLYQWGRFSDGHQCRGSSVTSTNSSTDTPGHSNFITEGTSPFDWRSPQNSNLWQGSAGVNNPCPCGYRIPTTTEWSAERASWSTSDAGGAFGSPLKIPVGGYTSPASGALVSVGVNAFYYTSTTNGNFSDHVFIGAGNSNIVDAQRANGFSIRCIFDD